MSEAETLSEDQIIHQFRLNLDLEDQERLEGKSPIMTCKLVKKASNGGTKFMSAADRKILYKKIL